ncbi:unnamed protein product, partial [Effrenium voratum]
MVKRRLKPAPEEEEAVDEPEEKPEKKEKRKRVGLRDGLERREWKVDEDYDGTKVRNVPFTEEDDAALLKALRIFCEEKELDFDAVCENLHKDKAPRGLWGRVALLSGLTKRRTWAICQRVRRILWGGHRWTEAELQILLDEASTTLRPSWKKISERLQINPSTCHDKYRDLCKGHRTFGRWTEAEDWTLRMAICETTDSLVPRSMIPWSQVMKWLPQRGFRMLMARWYIDLLPRLVAYEDKHGVAIETQVFVRHLLRKLKKTGLKSAKAVEWSAVNTWWSARMNRQKWRILSYQVPAELLEAGLQEQVDFWFQAMLCNEHKKRDKKLLRSALNVLERQAQEMDERGGEEAPKPPRPKAAGQARGKLTCGRRERSNPKHWTDHLDRAVEENRAMRRSLSRKSQHGRVFLKGPPP